MIPARRAIAEARERLRIKHDVDVSTRGVVRWPSCAATLRRLRDGARLRESERRDFERARRDRGDVDAPRIAL